MHPFIVRTTALLAAVSFFSGCHPIVAGSGVAAEERRELPAFTRVHIASGLPATIDTKADAPVLLRGDDNILPVVISEVRGDTLFVELPSATTLRPVEPLMITIGASALREVTASGGSVVEVGTIRREAVVLGASGGSVVTVATAEASRSLEVKLSGGSTFTLGGSAPSLSLGVRGGSVLSGEALTVGDAKVDLSGGSTASLRVTGRIDGELSGGSVLTVWGDAQEGTLSKSGGSKVERR